MRRAVDPIDDHPGDIQARVKVLKPHDRRGDRGGHRLAIHQQDHRAAELLGHRRRTAIGGIGAIAIIQPHHALDDGDVGLLHLLVE